MEPAARCGRLVPRLVRKNGYPAPVLPAGVERQAEHRDETRAVDRAAVERLLTRRDIPLREKTLWRMLYETAARAGEILALNIEDLEMEARRARIPAKVGATEYVYWASGTAHLLPRVIRGRQAGPVFLSERRPGPARRPKAKDLCPYTSRARLGYDRARILLDATPLPATAGPAGTCTNCVTQRPPTSAKPTPASS
jgi:integrase